MTLQGGSKRGRCGVAAIESERCGFGSVPVGFSQAEQDRVQPVPLLASASSPTLPASVAGHFVMESNDRIVVFDPSLEKAPGFKGSAADKVAKFKWRPLGLTGEFEWINKKSLSVDRSYQRDDEYKQKIISIAADWKWESCGAISVMKRKDGSYMVIDGQNRTLAAWRRSDISDLPCMVFLSKGIEHEASSFIEINTNRKPVSAYAKFRAKLVAADQSALEILSVLSDNQLILKADGKTPGAISCIAACQRLHAQSLSRFKATISIASDLARADDVGVCNILIGGLSVLDRKVLNGFSNKRLVQRLYEIGAIALVDAARKMSYRVGKGGEFIWAEGMLEIVNRKRGLKMQLRNGNDPSI
jgi:hypothetical protein